jgi:hypothetical protein
VAGIESQPRDVYSWKGRKKRYIHTEKRRWNEYAEGMGVVAILSRSERACWRFIRAEVIGPRKGAGS